MPVSPDLLGPYALLVGVLIAVGVLWKDHQRADADDRAQRDEAFVIAHAQVDATNRVASSYADIARDIATLSREVAAIRRDMAARRKADQ